MKPPGGKTFAGKKQSSLDVDALLRAIIDLIPAPLLASLNGQLGSSLKALAAGFAGFAFAGLLTWAFTDAKIFDAMEVAMVGSLTLGPSIAAAYLGSVAGSRLSNSRADRSLPAGDRILCEYFAAVAYLLVFVSILYVSGEWSRRWTDTLVEDYRMNWCVLSLINVQIVSFVLGFWIKRPLLGGGIAWLSILPMVGFQAAAGLNSYEIRVHYPPWNFATALAARLLLAPVNVLALVAVFAGVLGMLPVVDALSGKTVRPADRSRPAIFTIVIAAQILFALASLVYVLLVCLLYWGWMDRWRQGLPTQ